MGCYRITLDATDTNTVGELRIIFEEAATCLPHWQDYQVISANVYDALTGADLLDVSTTQIEGVDATDQINAACDASIETYHLDHLLANAYTPATPEGNASSLMNMLVENDGGVARFNSNTLETAPGGTPVSNLLQSTTILAYTSNTVFTLTAGSADDDAYNNQMIVITDQTTGTQKAVGRIANTGGYVGSSKTVTLDSDPLPGFTFANGDTVDIWAITGDNAVLEVDANGRVDVGNIAGTAQTPGDAVALLTTIDTVVDGIQTDLSNGTDGLGALSADIATAQADLDIITGATGVNLLTATQASIDAIEVDTSTTLDTKLNTIDTVVDGIQTDLDNATDGLGAIKTDTAAIKTKTDSLTFTQAGEVDANVQSINNAAVTGDGNGTPWDGA
jgi:hypothetical protein